MHRQPYLTTLTPLRGIAALFIIIGHSQLFLLPFVGKNSIFYMDTFWLWVDFFFILSGFIMSYVYGSLFQAKITLTDYKKYMGARFARIYPLYFAALTGATILSFFIVKQAHGIDPFIAGLFDIKAFPACALLIQSFHIYKISPLNFPSWSLSSEWWVDTIFPFMVPLFSNKKLTGNVAALLIIAGLYVFINNVLGPAELKRVGLMVLTGYGWFRCLVGFCAGMLLFEFYKKGIGNLIFKSNFFFIAVYAGLLLSIHLSKSDLCTVSLFPFLILAATYNQSWIKKLLETKAMQRLGDWSFSIYTVHALIIYVFYLFALHQNPSILANIDAKPHGNHKTDYTMGLLTCLAFIVCTLIVSALTYKYIEIPARNYLLKAFSIKRKKLTADSVEV